MGVNKDTGCSIFSISPKWMVALKIISILENSK
jgi:hypothetical protein